MPLEVGIVGLPKSGKTTLFNALTHAGAHVHEAKPHVGMAPIADPRLEQLAPVEGSAKLTPATIRVQDVPGTGPALLGNLRQVDALLCVLNGFSPGAAPPLIEALGLITFFTIGPTEARAWTLRSGRTALDAAEEIHTDIARGFIRCEVIHWSDLVEAGTRAETKKRGRERLEGKDYVV